MENSLVVYLDAGHGGMINGKYTTAPSKMFKHKDGSIAYEGVINRRIKDKLKELIIPGIRFIDVASTNEDKSLEDRCHVANRTYLNIRYKEKKALYLSIHSNAGGGSGFEVYTSPGQTDSDKYAQICCEEIKKEFSEFPFRAGLSDGDLDKEDKFYVLVKTFMPAILMELLFFDNPNDWKYQQTDEYYQRVVKSIVSFLKRSLIEMR
jgi:N-acetylmuramoyl-L-alanine amidase